MPKITTPKNTKSKPHIPFRERIYCSINEAAAATSISRSRIYELLKENRIASKKQGSRTLIVVVSLWGAV